MRSEKLATQILHCMFLLVSLLEMNLIGYFENEIAKKWCVNKCGLYFINGKDFDILISSKVP